MKAIIFDSLGQSDGIIEEINFKVMSVKKVTSVSSDFPQFSSGHTD